MLLQASNSFLLVIDIQSRLAPFIDKGSSLINNSCWLIEIAKDEVSINKVNFNLLYKLFFINTNKCLNIRFY